MLPAVTVVGKNYFLIPKPFNGCCSACGYRSSRTPAYLSRNDGTIEASTIYMNVNRSLKSLPSVWDDHKAGRATTSAMKQSQYEIPGTDEVEQCFEVATR